MTIFYFLFQEETHNFMIKGMAKPRIMFVHETDDRTPDIESLAEEAPVLTEDEGWLSSVISLIDESN